MFYHTGCLWSNFVFQQFQNHYLVFEHIGNTETEGLSRWFGGGREGPLSLSPVADDGSGGLRGRLLIDPSSLWPSLTRDVSPKEIVGVRTTIFFIFTEKPRKNCFIKPFPNKTRQLLLREWEAFKTWLHFESAFCPFSFYYSLSYLLIKSTICAFQTRYYSISIQLFTLLRFLIYYLPLLHKTSPKKNH